MASLIADDPFFIAKEAMLSNTACALPCFLIGDPFTVLPGQAPKPDHLH
jgi:hypothetical protein